MKKFNGDDSYSYAVFVSEEVKGMQSPIFIGQARPVASGLSRTEAKHLRDRLNKNGDLSTQRSKV
jgi:hypothetical protein